MISHLCSPPRSVSAGFLRSGDPRSRGRCLIVVWTSSAKFQIAWPDLPSETCAIRASAWSNNNWGSPTNASTISWISAMTFPPSGRAWNLHVAKFHMGGWGVCVCWETTKGYPPLSFSRPLVERSMDSRGSVRDFRFCRGFYSAWYRMPLSRFRHWARRSTLDCFRSMLAEFTSRFMRIYSIIIVVSFLVVYNHVSVKRYIIKLNCVTVYFNITSRTVFLNCKCVAEKLILISLLPLLLVLTLHS